MFCTNCGNKITDGERFCSQCGMKVIEEVAPQPQVEVAPQPISQPVYEQPNVQPAYMQPNVQPAYNQKPTTTQARRVSVLSIVGFAISVVALILSLVCMIEFYDPSGLGVTVELATFVSLLAEASLGLSIAGVIIASKKKHRLKPMGIVGISLGAVATLFMMIIMFEIGFLIGSGIY